MVNSSKRCHRPGRRTSRPRSGALPLGCEYVVDRRHGLVGRPVHRRARHVRLPTQRTGTDPARSGARPELPPGLTDVLAVLRSAAILLDAGQEVSTASPAAYAFGLVRGHDLVHSELHDMATEGPAGSVWCASGNSSCPAARWGWAAYVVNARVAPLGSEYVLVLVDDRTEARRVEEVHRVRGQCQP